MKIRYLESVDSTQLYLKNLLLAKKIKPPYGVVAKQQLAGVGSRENSWIGLEGNFFFSFAYNIKNIPFDLKLESASIYYAYLLKEVFAEYGSSVWLKWPNDFYIDDKKIGGMITNLVADSLVCGVGVNLSKNPQNFAKLDIDISIETILEKYIEKLEKKVLWKQVFSKYELEFNKSKNFSTHINNSKISLENVSLQSDGSIMYKNERIYSLR